MRHKFYLFISCLILHSISYPSLGQNRFSSPPTPSRYVPLPLEQLQQTGQLLDQRMTEQLVAEYQQVMNQIQNLKSWYSSQSTFNAPIENSWNVGTATDNYSFCGVRKVYVSGGKVIRYIGREGDELSILRHGTISNGKATIQLLESGDFIEVYF